MSRDDVARGQSRTDARPSIRVVTHGPPIFPRSVNGWVPDDQADARLREIRALCRRVPQAQQG